MCQVTQGVSPRAPDKGSRQSGCGRADSSRRDKHLTSLWLLAAGWRSHLMMTPVTQQQLSLMHWSMIWKWRMTPLSCVAPTQMTMLARSHREHYCRQVPASAQLIANVCVCKVCSGVGVGDTPPYGCNPVCRQDKWRFVKRLSIVLGREHGKSTVLHTTLSSACVPPDWTNRGSATSCCLCCACRLWLGRYGRKAKHLKGEKGGKIPELERSHLKGSKGGPGGVWGMYVRIWYMSQYWEF